ncbi:MAG TPA: phospholipase D-like domain-containing protein [Methylophilaceae bacterium]|jgi:cardiolipin synthase
MNWQQLLVSLLLAGCASVPQVEPVAGQANTSPQIIGARGPLSRQDTKALLARMGVKAEDADLLQTHLAIEREVAETPLVTGNDVRLLRNGDQTFAAMFAAIKSARHTINLEYYIFEDVKNGNLSLGDLLVAKRKGGVAINIIYDGYGSATTPKAFFDRLRDAGVQIVQFNPLNPLHAASFNHRDHRKILVIDGTTAIVGGVNLSVTYESAGIGHSVGPPANHQGSRWRDTDMQIEGLAVAELQKLFLQHWQEQNGPALKVAEYFPTLVAKGSEVLRIIGSAPARGTPRYYITMLSAIQNADRNIFLSSAFFVPTRQEKRDLIDAAKRGVDVRLLLPSVSSSASSIEVQHSHYEDLLEAGVKIYECQHEILHAKTVTVDGVWSVIGSSNFDHRSVLFNDEVDVVVVGRETAQELQAMFDDDIKSAKQITFAEWKKRPVLQDIKDHVSRFWEDML